ncbi:MAG: hypothetical protein V3V10_05360 [Planctomycetota bacterium]
MKSIFALIILLFASHASACAWDHDTLYEEEKGVENIRDLIIGNFIRNPPRYYEMRLERVSKILETDINNLDLYDDASVACDRLHQFDEAIVWQKKKLAALERLSYDGAKHKQPNHRYRHLANLGTHYVHRWLFSEDRWADRTDAETARDLIKAAIVENPNAHFGREIYQLRAIESILAQTDLEPTDELRYLNNIADEDKQASIDGIAGMIRLGAGWNSVDFFAALAEAFGRTHRQQLAALCIERVKELLRTGFLPLLPTNFDRLLVPDKDLRDLVDLDSRATNGDSEKAFPVYRSQVESWYLARVKYMDKQFDTGKHPDTHPDFWAGFTLNRDRAELTSADEITGNSYGVDPLATTLYIVLGGLALFVFLIFFVPGFLIYRHYKNKPTPDHPMYQN